LLIRVARYSVTAMKVLTEVIVLRQNLAKRDRAVYWTLVQ